jgi:hypothetical protein
MKKAKRLIAATTATLLSITAVPVFAQDITDKVYVANAIENTLKHMGADDSAKITQAIAKGSYNEKINMTLKDYTVPENILQKDIFDGYSILLDASCNPANFDMYYNMALKNPNGETLSANYLLKDSTMKISVPEIMDYYVNISANTLAGSGVDASAFDVQGKTKAIQQQIENLKNEVDIKVVGPTKADANLTEAKVTLKAASVNKFVNDYFSLLKIAEVKEIPPVMQNDIVVDLTIDKQNIVTAFSTTIKEPVVDKVYNYDEVTNESKETSVTKNLTFVIDGTYKNDQLGINLSALEDDKKAFDAKYVNKDTRDKDSKLTASKANMVITGAGTTSITMDMDATYKADGYTDVALNINTLAKSKTADVADEKHAVSVQTSYKTTVAEKEVKMNMPSFVVKADGMSFDFAIDYSVASTEFVMPQVEAVNVEDLTEEATKELSVKGLAQLYKVLPQAIMNKLVGSK